MTRALIIALVTIGGLSWCAAVLGALKPPEAPSPAPYIPPPTLPFRPEAELLTELRALEKRGRAMPRGDLRRCGDLMRAAQDEADRLRVEAHELRHLQAEEAAVFVSQCVTCGRSASAACAEARELLAVRPR